MRPWLFSTKANAQLGLISQLVLPIKDSKHRSPYHCPILTTLYLSSRAQAPWSILVRNTSPHTNLTAILLHFIIRCFCFRALNKRNFTLCTLLSHLNRIGTPSFANHTTVSPSSSLFNISALDHAFSIGSNYALADKRGPYLPPNFSSLSITPISFQSQPFSVGKLYPHPQVHCKKVRIMSWCPI